MYVVRKIMRKQNNRDSNMAKYTVPSFVRRNGREPQIGIPPIGILIEGKIGFFVTSRFHRLKAKAKLNLSNTTFDN